MTEIVQGLGRTNNDRIAALRKGGRFFWIDVSLDESSPEGLDNALSIPEQALNALVGFGRDIPSSGKYHADARHVVFAFTGYLESTQLVAATSYRLSPVEVHVLVSGEYVLTLHKERVSLPELLAPHALEGRSDQYAVYAILDAMIASAFDALDETEQKLDELAAMSTELGGGRVRMATLRGLSARLSGMRRDVGPQRGRFERIGGELRRLEALETDDERYFDHVGEQVNRLVDAIDAAANAIATVIDLRLNETIYWLTVVATIFLPLTFITGFFGMNFGWMIKQIDTQLAFWLLGIGSLVVGVVLIWRVVVRASPVEPGKDNSSTTHPSV